MPVHPDRIPSLVFANSRGEILDYSGMQMAGSSCGHFSLPDKEDLIELPEGSELFVLPGRLPVGIEHETGEPALLDSNPFDNDQPQAVAAFMAPAHTALYSAAYKSKDNAPILPLFAYTAVGWADNRFWVAGFRSDSDCRQDANQFNQQAINRKTNRLLKEYRNNRLVQHLGKCCLTYGCPAARNYFLGRWEAPLPSSPACNASCIGCISLQPSGCCPATQDRIQFVPRPAEIGEIAIPHLEKAPKPIVSFGQGCEGEPLLQAKTLEKSITLIRSKTTRGTINLNTNASLPQAVERLVHAGLDSIRVSLNSARPEYYEKYYRPRGFSFADMQDSITVVKKAGRHVSLNYFILPGFTDDRAEFAKLCELIESSRPDLIQLRNLNLDPEQYIKALQYKSEDSSIGIRNWLAGLKENFPLLKFGYFNPPIH
ncbi:MAG: radical SAM protein [Desulfobulbaceae bacterium]|nr:radical SAM protein [Desulfobulbaceae bacterium]